MSTSSFILESTPIQATELTDRDKLQVGAAYQQLFWQNNGVNPTLDSINEFLSGVFPPKLVEDYINSEEFQAKLEKQGLKTDSPVLGLLTPEQVMIANMELSLLDRRSIRQKLDDYNKNMKTLGGETISLQKVEGWKRDPAYQQYMAIRAKDQFEELETMATQNLARLIANGDLQATKLLFELKGRLNKSMTLNVNVEGVMVRIVEIIGRHVEDPKILDAIATEIEELNASPSF